MTAIIIVSDRDVCREFLFTLFKIAGSLTSKIAMLYENIELYEIIQCHAAKLQISINSKDKAHLRQTFLP